MLLLLHDYLISFGLATPFVDLITISFALGGMGLISLVLVTAVNKYLNFYTAKLLDKNQYIWEIELSTYKVMDKLAYLVPGILYYSISSLLQEFGKFGEFFAKSTRILSSLYIVVLFALLGNSLLNIVTDTYEKYEVSRRTPIRSYIQVMKIVLFMATAIILLSILLDKDPIVFFTGLGAAMAVLLIVFKDVLLGFVASIQIAFYDIVRIGDWVTISSFDAEGEVKEISLTTVKIRNADMTISNIPTYTLISSGVKNWRGMKEAGARRIKRSLNIDLNTIVFCTEDMFSRFSQIDCLKDILSKRQNELGSCNKGLSTHDQHPLNIRQTTNLGIFRLYINEYLKSNAFIHHKDFTFLIRPMQPTEHGIPLELFIFTNDTESNMYEEIQAEIFDHLIVAAPIFDLRIFQNVPDKIVSEQLAPKMAANQSKKLTKAS